MITDQLKAYCNCVEDITTDDVFELVNIVSLMTGWQMDSCETFLVGKRREVRDLPSCADCPIEFRPYYHPFIGERTEVEIDPETGETIEKKVPFGVQDFKFYLVKIQGTQEDITEITDFGYISTEGVFRINTGLPSCKCVCYPCGCPPEYKLVAEYLAGYDQLPECILPVFCHLLEVIKARRECECCDDCGCENQEQKVRYASGDVVSVALETELGKLLVEQYKNQLLTLVLHETPMVWGFVV